jgi:hypothetical protein
MALCTTADSAVGVGASDAMALIASASHGAGTFQLNKRMRRPPRATRLILFGERHLLRRQPLLAIDGCPGRRCVSAAQKFLVDLLVAAPAIPRRHVFCDHEAVMILLFLSRRGLVTIEAIHVIASVHAQLVLVNHRVSLVVVALGALARSAALGCFVLILGAAC